MSIKQVTNVYLVVYVVMAINLFDRSNPLGHGGVLADDFSFLMKSMWSAQYRFISPRDFKVSRISKIQLSFKLSLVVSAKRI